MKAPSNDSKPSHLKRPTRRYLFIYIEKKRYLKKKYSMSDLVVYKIKGKFFQNELIIQIKGNKKKIPKKYDF